MVHFKSAASILIAAAAIAPAFAASVPKTDPKKDIVDREAYEGKDSNEHLHHNHRAAQSTGNGGEEVSIVVHDRVEEVEGAGHGKPSPKSRQAGHRHKNERQSGEQHKHSGQEEELDEEITILVRPEEAGGYQAHNKGAAHRGAGHRSRTADSKFRRNGGHRKSVDSNDDERYEHSRHSGHRYSNRFEDKPLDDYRPSHRYGSARKGYRSAGHRHSDDSYGAKLQGEEYEGEEHHHHDGSTHRPGDRSAGRRYPDDSYVADEQPEHHHRHGSGHRRSQRLAGHRHSDEGNGRVDEYNGENTTHKHGHRHSSERKYRYGNEGLRASERTEDIENRPSHYRKAEITHNNDMSIPEPPRDRTHRHGYRTEKKRLGDSDFDADTQETFRYNDLD